MIKQIYRERGVLLLVLVSLLLKLLKITLNIKSRPNLQCTQDLENRRLVSGMIYYYFWEYIIRYAIIGHV